jgi:hypothetical protein
MNCIYKLRFEKSSYDLEKDYESLSEYQKEKIANMKPTSFFDFNDEQLKYTLYMIISPIDIKNYVSILDMNHIGYELDDISEVALKDEIELDDYLMKQSNRSNRTKIINFIEKKNEWVYENLDIDTVLDRISEVGMESLRYIEKKFLQNYRID